MSAPYTIYDAFWLDGWADVGLTVPAATATVAAVAPALGASFAVPAATSTTASVAPALSVRFAVPAATATTAAVAPAIRERYVAAAATATGALVAPALKAAFGVPASSASVSTAAGFTVVFAVPTMTTSDTAFAPTLEVTYTIPAAAVTAAMVAPDMTTEAVALPRLRGVGNGIVQVWELEPEREQVFAVPTMQARASMNAPRLIVSEMPMDADLSLLLELELV